MDEWRSRDHDNSIPLLQTAAMPPNMTSVERKPIQVQKPIRRKPVPSQSVVHLADDSPSHTTHRPQPTKHPYARIGPPSTSIHEDGEEKENQSKSHYWLPLALRWPFLLLVLAVSVALLIAVICLHVYSERNHGLGNDDREAAQYFGWRFVPTLLAVIYALFFTMILEDVKVTETYARLSQPHGGLGKFTVLQTPGAWWNALADGLSPKKNNGYRSWALVSSATSLILALLVISPLSSTLLLSEEVVITQQVPFSRMTVTQESPLDFGNQVIPRFRAISNIVQNITTSAWITENFTIMPFWPADFSGAPLGATLGSQAETWSAETAVLQTELICQPFHLVSKEHVNISASLYYRSNPPREVVTSPIDAWVGLLTLSTDDGCTEKFAPDGTSVFSQNGGFSWSRQGDFAGIDEKYLPIFNVSEQCSNDEVIILATALFNSSENSMSFKDWNPDLHVTGQVCNTSYYIANIDVLVNITETLEVLVTLNDEEFNDRRQVISNDVIRIEKFQDFWLSNNWTFHFVSASGDRPAIGGPSGVILAKANYSMPDVIADDTLPTQLIQAKRRYFGEAILSTLSEPANQLIENIQGIQTSIQERIIVATAVAFALEAAIFLEILLILAICWTTRQRQRPLRISSDPAKTTVIAGVIHKEDSTDGIFERLHDASKEEIARVLQDLRFAVLAHHLTILDQPDPHDNGVVKENQKSDTGKPTSWRPVVLSRWTIAGLLFSLLAVLVAIAILFSFSRGPGLYEKAFIYQAQIIISDVHLSTIAPYSIVPTLVAVGIGIWWSAMETEFRLLQPFVSMADHPVRLSEGVGLSYRSSYLFWAAVRAVSHRHWILTTLCTGALLSQIFTIAMSALWQPGTGLRHAPAILKRDLEIRTIPILTVSRWSTSATGQEDAPAVAAVLNESYGHISNNWLYSANIQLSLNGSQPPWSKDGWSFVPVDLSSSNYVAVSAAQTSMEGGVHTDASSKWSSRTTITITTQALRANLQCSTYEALSNVSNWLMPQDFSNRTLWNLTTDLADVKSGFTLGIDEHQNTMYLTPDGLDGQGTTFFSGFDELECCDNRTADGYGSAVMGYWSPMVYWNKYPQANDSQVWNFTAKWIYGNPIAGVLRNETADYAHIIWPEAPRMAAINCMPTIQKTNASVEVNLASGIVQRFSILEDAQDDESPWADYSVQHKNPNNVTVNDPDFFMANWTNSYGVIFLKALLTSSDIAHLGGYASQEFNLYETVTDLTFTFKQPGLNVDAMSYAMFQQVLEDPEALLDTSVLSHYANKTFATFFQHFVSGSIGPNNTGWAYQPIGATLPLDLAPPIYSTVPQSNIAPTSYTNRTVEVQVNTTVQVLQMSPLAAWLCMSILLCLTSTTVLILVLEKQHLGRLIKGTKTIADVAILLAGSHAFLSYLNEHGSPNGGEEVKTKLGWFRDRNGTKRWGIELFGGDTGVQWLNDGHDKSEDEQEVQNRQQTSGNSRQRYSKVPDAPTVELIEPDTGPLELQTVEAETAESQRVSTESSETGARPSSHYQVESEHHDSKQPARQEPGLNSVLSQRLLHSTPQSSDSPT